MVRYFYFFRDVNCPSVESVVYHVKVGSSSRELTKCALVQEFCKDCGLFFERVSNHADEAIEHLQKSIFTGSSLFGGRFRRASVSISELYSLIIDDSFNKFEAILVERKRSFLFLSNIDPNFHFPQRLSEKNLYPASPPRKYLKSAKVVSINSFLISSVTIAIIWIITAWLESMGY